MKQAFLAHEQKFFINGTQMSGIQSVEGSYSIQEKPINVLGWGLVGEDYYPPEPKIEIENKPEDSCYGFVIQEHGFFDLLQEDVLSCPEDKPRRCPNPKSMAVLNAPLEGNFSINSTLVSEDFFIQFLGDTPFTGSLHHGHEYFGFHSGYITSHTVSCAIGQVPSTSTSIRVFGDIGGSPNFVDKENDQFSVLDENGFAYILEDSYYNKPEYNAKGDNPFPEIRVPDQGSISIKCAGSETDRVVAFNHSINVGIEPIYVVGSAYAAQVDVNWPIITDTSFTLEVDEYKYQSLRKYMFTPTVEDIAIKINDCFGDPIQYYTIEQARLIGESVSSSVDGRLTVNLQYKSYYNKRGKLPHSKDFTNSNFTEAMWSPSFLRPTLWNDALDKNYLNLDGYAVKGWRSKGPNDAVLESSSGGFDPRFTQYIFNKKPAINFYGKSILTTTDININRGEPYYVFIAGQFKDMDKRAVLVDTLGVDFQQEFDRLLIERLDTNNIKVSTQTRRPDGILEETGSIKSKGDDIVDGGIKESYQSASSSPDTIRVEEFIITVLIDGDNSYLDINGRSVMIEGSLGLNQVEAFSIGSVMNEMEATINGFIAENVVIRGFIPDSEIFRTQGYLAHKWGFVDLLPEDHTYKEKRPVV